jgi:N-glycosylase/DNA lyase
LSPYVGALRGLRQMRPSCPREVLFSFLCTANNNLARILPMVRHLGGYGEAMEQVGGRVLRRFPTFERLAEVDEVELRHAGFGYRARTIPAVARQILSRGEGWWRGLAALGYEELHAELVSLASVGPKLADCIALFGFHCDEAAPMDTHLWQACCRHYFPEWAGKPLTDHRYRVAAKFLRHRFGSLTGWAHQYLFYDNLLNWRARRSV